MLTSLFGDLPPRRLPATAAPRSGDPAAAPGPAAAVDSPPAVADTIDVVVDLAPADAVRSHFSHHRQDLQRASAMLTLVDPSRLWAPQVLQALARAAGQPVQRLNLRDRASLRTLAVVERTLVPRRDAAPLRVYCAAHREGGGGPPAEDITGALAEGSQLTAVIVGAMQPHALVALLRTLLAATHQATWRCPELVFILPPGAAALRDRILAQDWPPGVRAQAVAEPLGSPAGLWNCVLQAWEAAQPPTRPAAAPEARSATAARAASPTPPGDGTARMAAAGRPPPVADASPSALLPLVVLNRLLLPLARSEGLLACGIVDLDNGDLLASQQRDEPPVDLNALAEAMCAARLAHQAVAAGEAAPEELLVTTGARQTLLRRLPGAVPLGFVAVLDRRHANLTLLRFKLLDAERILG